VFPTWWLAEFAQVLEADLSWYGGDIVSQRRSVTSQAVRPDGTEPDPWAPPEEDEADYWQGYSDCDYVMYSTRSGDHRSVHKLTDFSTTRSFFAHDPWAHYLRNVGVRHHITVPIRPVGQVYYDMGLSRVSGSDFTERHRLLLELLGPHLVRLHRLALAQLANDPDLTPRQWEVMRLVAVGMTNAQIARQLLIAEATVGKHLEGVYVRLGTNNRIAAVNKAFEGVAGD
jgi:DNA-binding CsgD family transcriptional regulator